jgi:hypothetical protein
MSTREVMKMALNALEKLRQVEDLEYGSLAVSGRAIAALKVELAKPKPEPVGYLREEDVEHLHRFGGLARLYNTPSGVASFAFPVYRKEDL